MTLSRESGRMPSDKDVKELLAECVRQGFRWEEGSKNYIIWPPDKTKSPVVCPKTPSSPNSLKKVRSQLKQRGFDPQRGAGKKKRGGS